MNKSVISISLVSIALLSWNLLPIPTGGVKGAYSHYSGLAYCQDRKTCLHEIGHKLDFDHGLISQSPEFAAALRLYVIVEFHQDAPGAWPVTIMTFLVGYRDNSVPLKQELYSNLFALANGKRENMPATLQPFYDWTEAYRLEGKLGNQQIYWFR